MLTDPFYDGLVLALFALLVVAVALMLGTLLHHARVSIRLRRQQRRVAVLLPLLCNTISGSEPSDALLTLVRRGDRAVLLPMLLQLAIDLRGEETLRISELAEDLGLAKSEVRRLWSMRTTERAAAVKNLGLLRVQEALTKLLHVARTDRQRDVRIASTCAIGEIGGRRAVLGLLSILDDPDPGVVLRAQEVLLEAAPDAAREIVSHARRTQNAGARCAAVDLLGALRDPLASELLLELIHDADPELRTKAVKAAATIADPCFRETFRALLTDPVWSVRCQAATGLGAIGAEEAIPELSLALADEAWWVRFNAASALAELGLPGRAALAEATTASETRQGEVARYVLERAGLDSLAA